MSRFRRARDVVEKDAVYVGGWSLRHFLAPKQKGGTRDSSEDRVSRVAVQQDWTAAEERALVRKLDLRVLLPCCIVYLFAFLDRAQIGNVRVLQAGTSANILQALHLEGRDFNWAVSITYIPVLLFIIPSNLVLKHYGAKCYLPAAMVLFGIISMTIAAARGAAGLFAARFFLGLPEAGVVPATIVYFSFWYKPTERAWRIGVFYSANSVAAGCSGFLALAIDLLNGKGGLDSWQWLFIIEGGLTILVAIPMYFMLLTFPEDSQALNERQRHIAINRLGVGTARQTDKTWDWAAVRALLSRPSTYIFFATYVCQMLVSTSQGVFAPTILLELARFSPAQANTYMSAVYFYTVPLLWLWPAHSDWTRERMWHAVLPLLLALPSYACWTWIAAHQTLGSFSGRSFYGLMYLASVIPIAAPPLMSYRASTLYGASEQIVGTGIQVGGAYFASAISAQLYPDSSGPWYLPAFAVSLLLIVWSILLALSLPAVLLWEARQRKAQYGHALPRRAQEDAKRSHVSAVQREKIQSEVLAKDAVVSPASPVD